MEVLLCMFRFFQSFLNTCVWTRVLLLIMISAIIIAHVLFQQLKNCVKDPTATSIRLFYRFVEVLEERLVEIRYSLLGRFLETLLVSLLSVDLSIQVLVGLILFSSSLVPQIVKGLGQYLRAVFTAIFEATRKGNFKKEICVTIPFSMVFLRYLQATTNVARKCIHFRQFNSL